MNDILKKTFSDEIRDALVDVLMRLKYRWLLVIGVITAVILSEIIVFATHHILWNGELSRELIFAGFITPLLDASLVLFIMVAIIMRLQYTSQNLNSTKKMLEDITQGISESILLLSKEQKVLWANETAQRQAGTDIVGKYCCEATHQSKAHCGPPNDSYPLCSPVATNGMPTFTEHICCDKGGKKIIVEVGVYPIKNDKGTVDRFVHISRDITERKRLEAERENLIWDLQKATEDVKQLSGLLPICMGCKKIRNDEGYWIQIENYISEHSEAKFTHALCDQCVIKFYPDFKREQDET